MHLLRTLTLLPRLALAWFALSLGVAAASPFIHPQMVEMVCSDGATVKLVLTTDEGTQELDATAMHCALCLPTVRPLPIRWSRRSPCRCRWRMPSSRFPLHVSQRPPPPLCQGAVHPCIPELNLLEP